MSAPLISVVVRSMDPPTLPRALASVALQDHPAIEVVLVAACGPSHRPIDASAYPFRLAVVVRDGPLMRPAAANAGIEAASGEYVTMLDHDDEFLAGHLSALAAALDADPLAGAAYSGFEVAEAGELFTKVGRPFHRLALFEKSYIHHSALLYRRSLLDTGIRYDGALDIHDDWDFVLQLCERTRFAYVERTSFRWHADTGTSGGGGAGNFDADKYQRQRRYVLDKWAAVRERHAARFAEGMARASAQAGANDIAGAEATLRALAADAAEDPDILNLQAMLRARAGDAREAAMLMERAVRARPDDPNLWFNSGIACAGASMPRAARRCFERALELAPDQRGARAWLARLAKEAGDAR
ncbi:MAG: glycosyltransferase [Burkholderiales bacterium]|nr:glycosyltransferase [Burkholderiales bacterium]MCE7876616.1 glycosyltransferase [Betaproteobacteria bacterium PRO3]